MVKVGITGGIGSGKTTVCKIWESLGAFILNADDLAKDLLTNNPDIKKAVINTFGKASYLSDGSLNRQYLAKEAFSKGRVEELNAVVHPAIPEAAESVMKKAEQDEYEVFVFEAALLFQNVRPGYLDLTVLVLADRKKRIERVLQRDHTDKENVLNRMENQQNFEKLTGLADIVITNNGSLEELEHKAVEVYRSFSD